MTYTPYSNLTDEELLSFGLSMEGTRTPLEMELLLRFEMRLDDEQTCPTLEGFANCRVKVEGEA